jgi:plastocyanin
MIAARKWFCATSLIAGLAWSSLSPGAFAASTNVSYGSYFFSPSTVTIHVGDTINWVGSGSHTLDGTGSDPICGGAFLPCSHTFNAAGTFPYECTLTGHAAMGMVGTVVVTSLPITAARLTNAVHLTNGQFRFTVMTTANHTNIVQATTNLASSTNWVALATTNPAASTFVFTDTNAPGLRFRFYRVIEPP